MGTGYVYIPYCLGIGTKNWTSRFAEINLNYINNYFKWAIDFRISHFEVSIFMV